MQAFNVQSLEGAGAAFLPDQSFRGWRPDALRPEQRLMLAVLCDAVQVFQVCGTSAGRSPRHPDVGETVGGQGPLGVHRT
jgi:hypothetical protein